jgi:hypothetical protein
MTEHNLNLEQCYRLIETQITTSSPERIEILPILRARFGNLLREEIVSVVLDYQRSSYWAVISWLGEGSNRMLLDPYLSNHIREVEQPFFPSTSLWMDVIGDWLVALDDYRAVRDFQLFTDQSLGLIERIGSCADSEEGESKTEQVEKAFYLASAKDMAKKFAPDVYQKVEAAIRKKYKSSPGNGMVGDECETEWQELGAMLLEGTHLLLDVGIQQLQFVVAGEIEALSRPERLALWFSYCEYLDDYVSDHKPDDTFDLPEDSYAFEEIVESIARDLQNEMVLDWEKKLSEIESNEESAE